MVQKNRLETPTLNKFMVEFLSDVRFFFKSADMKWNWIIF